MKTRKIMPRVLMWLSLAAIGFTASASYNVLSQQYATLPTTVSINVPPPIKENKTEEYTLPPSIWIQGEDPSQVIEVSEPKKIFGYHLPGDKGVPRVPLKLEKFGSLPRSFVTSEIFEGWKIIRLSRLTTIEVRDGKTKYTLGNRYKIVLYKEKSHEYRLVDWFMPCAKCFSDKQSLAYARLTDEDIKRGGNAYRLKKKRGKNGKITFFVTPGKNENAPNCNKNSSDKTLNCIMSTYGEQIKKAAKKYGIDEVYLAAIVYIESGGSPWAMSRKGAKGLCQFMDGTAKLVRMRDSFSPQDNLLGCARNFANLLKYFNNDTVCAIAAHNAGPGGVDPKLQNCVSSDNTETTQFVDKVLGAFEDIQARFYPQRSPIQEKEKELAMQ